jgi:hypothetical protein
MAFVFFSGFLAYFVGQNLLNGISAICMVARTGSLKYFCLAGIVKWPVPLLCDAQNLINGQT